MNDTDKAYWLADKIPAYGDYAKEAANLLKKLADQVLELQEIDQAAKNLVAQKGLHHTEQAYAKLESLILLRKK